MSDKPDMSLARFEREYAATPAWDIGRAQTPFVDLFGNALPASPVLEVGCGTGDLALYMAGLGCDVLGIDFAPGAIAASNAKNMQQENQAEFRVLDVFDIGDLNQKYNSIVDCCFFHMFDDAARGRYEDALAGALSPGGKLYMLNFAIALPSPDAPRAITAVDIEHTFAGGWNVVEIKPATIEVTFAPAGVPGTYACVQKADGC